MTEDQELRVISHGIQLMKVITDIHGAEKGMELWGAIGESLGNDIKGKIFFSMLNGSFGNSTITIKSVDYQSVQKIPLIKAIRSVDTRSLGLTDAKLLSEELIDRKNSIVLHINSEAWYAAKRELVNAGCILS